MIEPGRYRARAIEGVLGKAKTGTEQIEVRFQLLDVAQSLTWRGFFTDATEERTMKALEISGWKWTPLCFPEDAPEVSLVIEHEEGQDGKTYPKVRWVNEPYRLTAKQPLTGDEVNALRNRLFGGVPSAAADDGDPGFDPNSQEDGPPF